MALGERASSGPCATALGLTAGRPGRAWEQVVLVDGAAARNGRPDGAFWRCALRSDAGFSLGTRTNVVVKVDQGASEIFRTAGRGSRPGRFAVVIRIEFFAGALAVDVWARTGSPLELWERSDTFRRSRDG